MTTKCMMRLCVVGQSTLHGKYYVSLRKIFEKVGLVCRAVFCLGKALLSLCRQLSLFRLLFCSLSQQKQQEEQQEQEQQQQQQQQQQTNKAAPRSIYDYERHDAPVCGRPEYLARKILCKSQEDLRKSLTCLSSSFLFG